MTLILTPCKKALNSLELALKQEKNEFTRDACIKRFEYSYELCWKLMKRHLSNNLEIETNTVKDIFRQAAKIGLIASPETWFAYHRARNLTAHTYNEPTAEETYQAAKQFYHEAVSMLNKLEQVLKDDAD